MMRELSFLIIVGTLWTNTLSADQIPVDLPPGFSITKVAGNELIPDASAMTVAPDGNPIVSGPGYVRKLVDANDDGVFEAYETLAETRGIAQGIWYDGESLWLSVDGAIQRSVSKALGKPFVMQKLVSITTGVEHGCHAIRKGPDGWWYVLCGNATDIKDSFYSLASSPVKEPHAGFLMRFAPEVKTGKNFRAEIHCHGFRNPYDFDFDSQGNVYVFDSDGERDVSLPWYRPTRVFCMQPGDDAGWVSKSWKRPASFYDMPELVGQLGRGSPTGVAACDTETFGARYKDTIFLGDWTFGRIGIAKRGVGVEVFAKAAGSFGFAVTDLEFAPGKGLFVTTGGRRTKGALYLISATKDTADMFAGKPPSHLPKKRFKPISIVTDQNVFARHVASIASRDRGSIRDDIRALQLMLGGCAGHDMFAGHEAKSPIEFSKSVGKQIGDDLKSLLQDEDVSFEVARLVGMLQLDHQELSNTLAKVSNAETDPVKRIHYLNCLAVTGTEVDPRFVAPVAKGLLRVRREIDMAELPVDRNWLPQMRQLAQQLFRDMRVAEAIVNESSFGNASDVWMIDSLPLVFHRIASAKIAARIEAEPENVTASQLRVLSRSASRNPRYAQLLRTFSGRQEFNAILVKAFCNQPTLLDFRTLLGGIDDVDPGVQKASLIGLRKLECSKLDADQKVTALKRMFRHESRLGWSNPEISIRDQLALLLKDWSPESLTTTAYPLRQYDLVGEELQSQKRLIEQWKTEVAAVFRFDIKESPKPAFDLERIDFSIGDIARGRNVFEKLQCATCHNDGGRNAGPSLAGITSRFSKEDIFEAIVNPNAHVPDRYRAMLIATDDGKLYLGSVVYESKAGIMLETQNGELVRIAQNQVEERAKSERSLMPEGLLDTATPQEIADLWSFLSQIR